MPHDKSACGATFGISSAVTTTQGLREFTNGSGETWGTTEIFIQHDSNIVGIQRFDSMYKMLSRDRFDFTSRDVNEIYDEKNLFFEEFKQLAVVPGLAVLMPLLYYAFVNEKDTRLALRLEAGLNKAFTDGSAQDLIKQYYGTHIASAELSKRDTIHIQNKRLIDCAVSENLNDWYIHDPQIKRATLPYIR